MNLEDISEIYQKNLIEFFSNEKVMDIICEEQYGFEEYELHKEEYEKRYMDVLKNTVFVPYTTLEGLETFLVYREATADLYDEKTAYEEEHRLCRRLTTKKKEIVRKYTKELIEEIKKIDKNFEIDETGLSDINYEGNLKMIEEKTPRGSKVIEMYRRIIQGKLIIETTSFFKHLRDIPRNKYYTSTMDNLTEKKSFVVQKIGKKTEKNCRYIYLPILSYSNKNEYLITAVHEFMHISKEQIKSNSYQMGFLQMEISSNGKISDLYAEDAMEAKFIKFVEWFIFKKKNNKKLSEKLGNFSYASSEQFEEAIHHWQVRKVADRIIGENLDSLLKAPYTLDLSISANTLYELSDRITERFFDFFEQDVQEINSGRKTIRGFKTMVCPRNYNLLCKVFESCHKLGEKIYDSTDDREKYRITRIGDISGLDDHVELGEIIMEQMKKRYEQYIQKASHKSQSTHDEDFDDR